MSNDFKEFAASAPPQVCNVFVDMWTGVAMRSGKTKQRNHRFLFEYLYIKIKIIKKKIQYKIEIGLIRFRLDFWLGFGRHVIRLKIRMFIT